MAFFAPDQRQHFTNDLLAFSLINEDTVDEVIDSKLTVHNQRIYKVRWKDSWLLEDQLKEHCFELMKKFWKSTSLQLPCFGKTFSTPASNATHGDDVLCELAFSEDPDFAISKENNASNDSHERMVSSTVDTATNSARKEANDANSAVKKTFEEDEDADDSIDGMPPDALTFLTDTEELSKTCIDCQSDFKTKCTQCFYCRFCRRFNRYHYYECNGDKVCAICGHCCEKDTCSICCPYCGHAYPTNKHMRRHIREMHLGLLSEKRKAEKQGSTAKEAKPQKPKIFDCDVCEKSFADVQKLRRHKKIHSDVKEFKCHVCEKEFSQKVHLQKHLLQHGIGEKRFKCHKCEKWFNHKISLRTHAPKCNG